MFFVYYIYIFNIINFILIMVDPNEMMNFGVDTNLGSTNNKGQTGIAAKHIHLYIRQRTIRKCYTNVYGIAEDIDLNLVLKAWKKKFNCSGAIKKEKKSKDDTKEREEFIELFGDHRAEVVAFLIYEGIGTEEMIKIHGA